MLDEQHYTQIPVTCLHYYPTTSITLQEIMTAHYITSDQAMLQDITRHIMQCYNIQHHITMYYDTLQQIYTTQHNA